MLVHTAFASSKDEAQETLEAMKKRLVEICQIIPLLDDPEREAKSERVTKAIEAFVQAF